MKKCTSIELLSPARNKECGIEAIKHGADAIYIGAGRFGARQAAGNSIEDIAEVVTFAHMYHAKVYVTVNTIFKDSELSEAEQLIDSLYSIGVDALLVQDMALLRMKLPPIAIHASTQMDVRTPQKVRFLADCGVSRVVLARELSLKEIAAIHKACPDVELECFVHGALCVSYSGQCYASENTFSRSANRGECAQFCRLKFDLMDADGKVIIHDRHLLSLKDMNRIEYLEELMDAGVVSFKIEGRLKETAYVKNVTAAYNSRLTDILKRRSDYVRASSGTSEYTFRPALEKSFNRGFTDYFLFGRTADIFSFNSPKSIGEPMGTIAESGNGWLTVSGQKAFHNGDGLCFFSEMGQLEGYRVNRVDHNRIYLYTEGHSVMPRFIKGTPLYRNFDQEFDRILSKESAVRRIEISMAISETASGFSLVITDSDGFSGYSEVVCPKDVARTPQTANIRTQLHKLGTTCFTAGNVDIRFSSDWFIPSSLLSELRRNAVEDLVKASSEGYCRPVRRQQTLDSEGKPTSLYSETKLTYLGNVLNAESFSFYKAHGVQSIDPAFEKTHVRNVPIMFCRHCLRYAFGWCPVYQKGQSSYSEPYYLRTADHRMYRLQFDCRNCCMLVFN